MISVSLRFAALTLLCLPALTVALLVPSPPTFAREAGQDVPVNAVDRTACAGTATTSIPVVVQPGLGWTFENVPK